jgi:4-hydroxybenzoate polyprenyltransferase
LKLDKKHPKKKVTKPLASGKIKKLNSLVVMMVLSIIAATLLFFISNYKIFIISVIFISANFLYSKILKKIVIIDILALSSNYVIRAYAGSVVINVDLSNWMAITIFFGALFISSLKRKQELLLYGNKSRPVLEKYTLHGIKKIVDFSGIIAVIFYNIYILTINEKLIITIPVILYGFFKYHFISDSKNFSDSPVDEILNNKDIILTILIWILLILIL